MTKILTCYEHQRLSRQDFYDEQDFDWLIKQVQIQQLPCFNFGHKNFEPVLIVLHYLCVIRLPSGSQLEVLPKIANPVHWGKASLNDTSQVADAEAMVSETKMAETALTETVLNEAALTEKTAQWQNKRQTRRWVQQMLDCIYQLSMGTKLPVWSMQQRQDQQTDEQMWWQLYVQRWIELMPALPSLLPRQYLNEWQNQPNAQGKLQVKEQLKHNAHRPHYLVTTQTQLRQDPLWQRFFVTVLEAVRQGFGVQIPVTVSRVLQTLWPRYQGTALLPAKDWQRVYETLLAQASVNQVQQSGVRQGQLTTLLSLSWLLLRWQQPTLAVAGRMPTAAVMINMQQAFELWVTEVLKQRYPEQVLAQARYPWMADDRGNLRYIQPDVVLKTAHAPNAQAKNASKSPRTEVLTTVIDVKYKHITRASEVSAADLYQLSTYAHVLNVSHAWLVYPIAVDWDKMADANMADVNTSKPNVNNHHNSLVQKLSVVGQQNAEILLVPFDVVTGQLLI